MRQLGRPRRKLEDNTETDLKKKPMEGQCVDWIHLTQDTNLWRAIVNISHPIE